MPMTREELPHSLAGSVTPVVSPDGQTVVLQYAFDEEKTVNIALDVEHSRRLLRDLTRLMSASSSDGPATGGPGLVRMTTVAQASANATDQAGEVALCLIDDVGVAHYYSLPIQASGELRSSLRSAEGKARAAVG